MSRLCRRAAESIYMSLFEFIMEMPCQQRQCNIIDLSQSDFVHNIVGWYTEWNSGT